MDLDLSLQEQRSSRTKIMVQISYLLEIHTQVFLLLWTLNSLWCVHFLCYDTVKINLSSHEKNIFIIIAVRQFITCWTNKGTQKGKLMPLFFHSLIKSFSIIIFVVKCTCVVVLKGKTLILKFYLAWHLVWNWGK